MTTDEAIEVLGGLVAQAGGEGDDALDTIKDALAPEREALDVLEDLHTSIPPRHARRDEEEAFERADARARAFLAERGR